MLAASVALNVLLVLLLLRAAAHSQRPSAARGFRDRDSAAEVSGSKFRPTIAGRPKIGASAAPTPTPWSRIASTNFAQYAANLRHAGCPEETLCDILGPAVERHFEDEDSRRGAPAGTDFWAMGESRRRQRQEDAQRRADLLEEKDRLRAVLTCAAMPDDDLDDLGVRLVMEWIAGFLGPERQEALIRWGVAAEARAVQWEARTEGLPLPEEVAAIRKEREDFLRRLEPLITESEWEEAALRLTYLFESDRFVTSEARQALTPALTPEELRELCRIENSRENRVLGEVDRFRELLGEALPVRTSAELEAEFQALLGEARSQEFLRQRDPAFNEAKQVAVESGLPPEVPDQIHGVLESFRADIPGLRSQWGATREPGRHRLQERRDEVRQQLQDLLAGLPEEERERLVREWTDGVIRSHWNRP